YNPTKYQKKFSVELKGKSKVISNINSSEIKIDVIDNGDAVISGKTEEIEGIINGSGDIHAYDLVADKCKIEINGSGNVRCSPKSNLKANIHGSGDIYYKGTPEIKSEITGSGQIKRESK
ncbi:MAG: GIN domain-containing protein, partial [Bacteroidota bacterium]